jgi:glucose/arabinose dehydrogenase
MIRANRLALAAVLLLGACKSQQAIGPDSQFGSNPALPDYVQYIIPESHVPTVVGWKAGETPTVPAGFQVQALATGLGNPRNVFVLPNGDILAIETNKIGEPVQRPKDPVRDYIQSQAHGAGGAAPQPTNRITLIRDANGDGKPELRTVFIDHLNAPFGVALVGSDLYVANTDGILRFPYVTGETRIAAPGQLLTDLPAGQINHHYTKSLVASPDGTKLYAGTGSNSNIMERGVDEEDGRARIWEIDRQTGAKRPFATGMRNPNGLNFYPGSNTLWAVVNERDELGPNLVPDYMTSVRQGAFYGWPYSYYGQHLDPRVEPQRPDLVAKAIPPDYALSSHVAPLGMTFYTGASFPAKFRGGAFVGEHGSWNRGELHGYKVVFIAFRNGRPIGIPKDFVSGFVKDGKARGRPVGVAIDRSGALLIADDVGNAVWQVRYVGPPGLPQPPVP